MIKGTNDLYFVRSCCIDADPENNKRISLFFRRFYCFIVHYKFFQRLLFSGTIIGAVVNMYLRPLSRLLNHKKELEINEQKINRLLLQKFGRNHLEKRMVSMISTLIQYSY